MNDDNDFVHVNSINRRVRERTKKSMNIYEDMLKKCFHRVKVAVDLGEKSCFYILPEFILGKPTYDMKECLKYIYDNIIKYGYYVKFLPPNIFFISWIQAYNSTYRPITNEYVVKTAYQQYIEDTKVTEQQEQELATQYMNQTGNVPPALTNGNTNYRPIPNTNGLSLVDSHSNQKSIQNQTQNTQENNEPSIFNIVPRTGQHHSSHSSNSNEKPEYKPLKFNPDMKNLFK